MLLYETDAGLSHTRCFGFLVRIQVGLDQGSVKEFTYIINLIWFNGLFAVTIMPKVSIWSIWQTVAPEFGTQENCGHTPVLTPWQTMTFRVLWPWETESPEFGTLENYDFRVLWPWETESPKFWNGGKLWPQSLKASAFLAFWLWLKMHCADVKLGKATPLHASTGRIQIFSRKLSLDLLTSSALLSTRSLRHLCHPVTLRSLAG